MDSLGPNERPSKGQRLLLTVIAFGLMSVFGIAFCLNPDPRGFGTHQQLGLPACQFREFAGVLCPHCGMTTSFSNVVRGNFSAAVQANPMGVPLSLAWAVCIPWCLSVAASGRWLGTQHPFQWLIIGTITYLSLAFLFWVGRIFVL